MVDSPPVAKNDSFTTPKWAPISGNLFWNNGSGLDFDSEGALTVIAVNASAGNVGAAFNLFSGGSLQVKADGSFYFDPLIAYWTLATGATAQSSFTYTVRDSAGQTATATVTLNFTGLTITSYVGMNNGDGPDTMGGDQTATVLYGLAGDDILLGGPGNDFLVGSSGSDTASYQYAQAGVTVSLVSGAQNSGGGGNDTSYSIENLKGSAYNDTLTGDDLQNRIDGAAGNDTIVHSGGGDILTGGAGTDTYVYRSASDLDAVGDTITDFGGADQIDLSTIRTLNGMAGLTFIGAAAFSGGGAKQLRYGQTGGNTQVLIDTNGDGVSDGQITLTGLHTLQEGAAGSLILTESGAPPVNAPVANADTFDMIKYRPLTGNVFNSNGSGVDSDPQGGPLTVVAINGSAGLVGSAFTLAGGGRLQVNADGSLSFDPLAAYAGLQSGATSVASFNYTVRDAEGLTSTATVTLNVHGQTITSYVGANGGAGADTLYADQTSTLLYGLDGDDVLVGGPGDDILVGGAGADAVSYQNAQAGVIVDLSLPFSQFNGSSGFDTLVSIENIIGSNANDTLTGDAGANRINGGSGDDIIRHSGGGDTLAGDLGSDTFVYRTAADLTGLSDTILGFGIGDRLDFSAIRTAPGGLSSMAFIGTSAFSGVAGQFRYAVVGGTTEVQFDSNGDGTADGKVLLTGAFTLQETAPGSLILSMPAAAAPVAKDDSFAVYEYDIFAKSVFANNGSGLDTDPAGGSLTVVAVNGSTALANAPFALPGGGTVVLTGGGLLRFDAGGAYAYLAWGQTVVETLTYTVRNAAGVTADATITITVNGANTPVITGSAAGETLTAGAPGAAIYALDGDDTLVSSVFNDLLDGGAGSDTADYSGIGAAVQVNLLISGSQYTGAGTDTLIRIENITGSAFNDVLTGDGGANRINGGSGDDVIYGGAGADILTGGAGADTFGYLVNVELWFVDHITDFGVADRINVSGTGATFIGDAAFSGVAGQLRYAAGAGQTTELLYDANGDSVADGKIVVAGQFTFSETAAGSRILMGAAPGLPPVAADDQSRSRNTKRSRAASSPTMVMGWIAIRKARR